jgi:hypothetical protein
VINDQNLDLWYAPNIEVGETWLGERKISIAYSGLM